MIEIVCPDDEVERLRELALNHPHHVVRRKALAVLLKIQQLSTSLVSNIVGVCENTVRNYLNAYLEGGIQQLSEVCFNQAQSELKPFDEEIKDYFSKSPPSTILNNQAGLCRSCRIHRHQQKRDANEKIPKVSWFTAPQSRCHPS